MAESVVQRMICDACGAEIRGGSLYCYNCGETLASIPGGKLEQDAPELVIAPENGSEPQAVTLKPEELRSAASLSKRAKVFKRQPLEYTWEKRTKPSPAFVLAAIVLTIFTAILLFMALYLR